MNSSYSILLISANVASLFDFAELLPIWTNEVSLLVKSKCPDFIAIHCQEFGGKFYASANHYVDLFLNAVLNSDFIRDYPNGCLFFDETYTQDEKFTALSNLYFFKESVQIYNFEKNEFDAVKGIQKLRGDIEFHPWTRKVKFPLELFPDKMWSRKGFMRTRWRLKKQVIDLVNVHLFHEACNLSAMENYPSVYGLHRRQGLQHILDELNPSDVLVPFFIFGDFNFRLDVGALMRHLTRHQGKAIHNDKGVLSRIVFPSLSNNDVSPNRTQQIIAFIEKKKYFLTPPLARIIIEDYLSIRPFDKEVEYFVENSLVCELPVSFPPTYPYREEFLVHDEYEQTRCPAWCDRILFSSSAHNLIQSFDSTNLSASYNVIGSHLCIGDHKPVYLFANLNLDS